MDRRPHPPTYQTPPYHAPLLAWLSLGPGDRTPFLAQALHPGPHATSHFMPVPPESRCGHPAGGLTHKTTRHLAVGNMLPKVHPMVQDRHSGTRPWPVSGHQEEEELGLPVLRKPGSHSTGGQSLPLPLSDSLGHKSLLYLVLFFINDLSEVPRDHGSLSEGGSSPGLHPGIKAGKDGK